MKIKKFLMICLACLLFFALCSCEIGRYVPPDSSDSGASNVSNSSGGAQGSDSSGNSGEDEEGDDVFTVTLVTNTSSFSLAGQSKTISARWTDMESSNSAFYTAEFDSKGVAKISGLDGDYKVTLTDVPDGYTYNPNIYEANNESRDVYIVLYPLSAATGLGTGWVENEVISLTSMGVYRATLTKSNYEKGVHFKFKPTTTGLYSVQSIIDITANELNPILDVYMGNSGGYVNEASPDTRDDGGEANTYTKNFLWSLQLTDVGNVFYFCVRATTLSADVFPINVDFILDKDGEISGGGNSETTVVTPAHDFEAAADTAFDDAVGTFTYMAWYNGNRGVLHGSDVKLGDDGYYHLYDAETETYGKKIYAKINKDTEIIGTDSQTGFCDGMVRLTNLNGYNYTDFIRDEERGYAAYVNGDGVYPVTEELKVFLQNYAVAQRLFNDGNGYAEGAGYNSSETDQWLFACGYYA